MDSHNELNLPSHLPLGERDPFSYLTEGAWATIAVIWYALVIFFREVILIGGLGIHPSTPTGFAQAELADMTLRMPVIAIGVMLYTRRASKMRQAFMFSQTLRGLTIAVGITCAISLTLNSLNLWPFAWRWPTDATPTILSGLKTTGHHLTIGIWMFDLIVFTPIVEEMIFRHWLLFYPSNLPRLGSALMSSFLFGLAHLGYGWPPNTSVVVKSTWLLVFSLVLCRLVLNRKGDISTPIVVHATRNALEFGILLGVLSSN